MEENRIELIKLDEIINGLSSPEIMVRDGTNKMFYKWIDSIEKFEVENPFPSESIKNSRIYRFIEMSKEMIDPMLTNLLNDTRNFNNLRGCLLYLKIVMETVQRFIKNNNNNYSLIIDISLYKILEMVVNCIKFKDYRVHILCTEILSLCLNIPPIENIVYDCLRTLEEKTRFLCEKLKIESNNSDSLDDNVDSDRELCNKTSPKAILDITVKCIGIIIDGVDGNFSLFNHECFTPLFKLILIDVISVGMPSYIKESGFRLIGNIAQKGLITWDCLASNVDGNNITLLCTLNQKLIQGMNDELCQVRLSAIIALYQFYQIFQKYINSSDALCYFPAVCINKHYAADGIKIQAKKCWKLMTKDKGLEIVHNNIHYFLTFYQFQLINGSINVREAAIHCIAEIVSLIDVSIAKSDNTLLPKLVQLIAIGMKDNHWSICDISISTAGTLMTRFKSNRLDLEKLIEKNCWAILLYNLTHTYQIIRCGAALTICQILYSSSEIFYIHIESHINKYLKSIENENNTTKSLDNIKNHSQCNSKIVYNGMVAVPVRCSCLNDDEIRPWEMTEGCIVLLGVLAFYSLPNNTCSMFSNIKLSNYSIDFDTNLLSFKQELYQKLVILCTNSIPFIVECLFKRFFPDHVYLMETVLDFLPPLIVFSDKFEFKRTYLIEEKIFNAINYLLDLENLDNRLMVHIEDFLINLEKIYGKRIITSKLSEFCPNYCIKFSKVP